METGKAHRWRRIVREDNRALIVALDHASYGGPMPGVERPGDTIAKLVKGGADAILTTYGTAREFVVELRGIGLILRVGTTHDDASREVEAALRLGADAVLSMGFIGDQPMCEESLEYLAKLATYCDHWQLPLFGEMLAIDHVPVLATPGKDPDEPLDKAVARAARIGAEYGVDAVKTRYTGSPESFAFAVDGCYVPLFVLGGKYREGREDELFNEVRSAVRAGGFGVVMGRNIWQHPHPDRMARALSAIIHGNADVESALRLLS